MEGWSCRGGNTAVIITPDIREIYYRHCKKIYTHAVVTKSVFPEWGWYKWCESLQEAKDCVTQLLKSKVAQNFKGIEIVECRMLTPYIDFCRIDNR